MYLLDTNAISELRKSGTPRIDPRVEVWASSVDPCLLYLPVIAILELELGIRLLERRDQAQGKTLRAWLDRHILPAFSGRILPIDVEVAQRCAALHVPNPRPERDALIAATALAHSMTVVTRDEEDFQGTGVSVLNPWLPML